MLASLDNPTNHITIGDTVDGKVYIELASKGELHDLSMKAEMTPIEARSIAQLLLEAADAKDGK